MKNFFKKSRSNKGFSLVELIVVIAIMAIIAGVSIPVYNLYIDKAKKGNDVSLVGDVIKAIEIGVNSAQFVPSDSIQLSAIKFPVGFVVLTNDGIKVLTSGTSKSQASECEFETATVKKINSESIKKSCGWGSYTETVYTITDAEIKYCKNHGAAPISLATDREYVTSFTGCTNSGLHFSHNWEDNIGKTTLYAGTLTADSSVRLVSSNDATKCEYAYANKDVSFTGPNVVNGANSVPMDTTHPIYQALAAAYGDLSQVKLTYDSWTSEEGVDYSTFYTYGPTLMEDLEDLSGVLALASKYQDVIKNKVGKDVGISREYSDGEDVLLGISENIVAMHPTEESWLDAWGAAKGKKFDEWGFNVNGRENYSAIRAGYNNAFASYLVANGITDQTVINIIKDYNSMDINVPFVGWVYFPAVVNTDAFNTADENGLKKKFEDKNLDTGVGSLFEKCKNLYEEYKDSQACVENGKALYNSMVTFQQNKDVAMDSNNPFGGDVFDYYNSYVDEMASLYTAAQSMAGEGIIIIVNSENGKVTYTVTPSAADPRN